MREGGRESQWGARAKPAKDRERNTVSILRKREHDRKNDSSERVKD